MASESGTHWKVAFSNSWLTDERLKLWVKKGWDCRKTAFSLCNNAAIDVANMGVSTLSLYAIVAKHQESFRNYNPTAPLFFKKDQESIPCTFSATANNNDGRIDTMMNSAAVFCAEFCWVMKVVTSHFSYHSCLNMNSLWASMFLESPTVNLFRCQKPSALITLHLV